MSLGEYEALGRVLSIVLRKSLAFVRVGRRDRPRERLGTKMKEVRDRAGRGLQRHMDSQCVIDTQETALYLLVYRKSASEVHNVDNK